MKGNALYFPYINVPQNDWLYTMLLYWDKVSSIVPYEYLQNPDSLSPFMGQLVREGLIHQVIPAQYINDQEQFAEPFLKYISKRKRNALTLAPTNFFGINSARPVKIHIEKIGVIAPKLERMGLLKSVGYPWYEVPSWVGIAFMAYLATCLGLNADINAQPVTDNLDSYKVLGGMGLAKRPTIEQRQTQVRDFILKSILPTPQGELDIPKIVRFKERNSEALTRFRGKIESVCLDLANRPALVEEQLKLKAVDLHDEVEEIAAKIKAVWKDIIFKDVFPIVSIGFSFAAELPDTKCKIIASGTTVAAAVRQFYASLRDNRIGQKNPLVYAAFARRKFSGNAIRVLRPAARR